MHTSNAAVILFYNLGHKDPNNVNQSTLNGAVPFLEKLYRMAYEL